MSLPKKTNNIKLTIADLDKAINEQALKIQSNANNKDYNPSGDELYLSRLFHVRNTNVLDCLENNQDVLLAEIKKMAGYLKEIREINAEKAKNKGFWSKFKTLFNK